MEQGLPDVISANDRVVERGFRSDVPQRRQHRLGRRLADQNIGTIASRTVDRRDPAKLSSLVLEILNSRRVRCENWKGRRSARGFA